MGNGVERHAETADRGPHCQPDEQRPGAQLELGAGPSSQRIRWVEHAPEGQRQRQRRREEEGVSASPARSPAVRDDADGRVRNGEDRKYNGSY